jgi:hypothetical protein
MLGLAQPVDNVSLDLQVRIVVERMKLADFRMVSVKGDLSLHVAREAQRCRACVDNLNPEWKV